MAPSFLIRVIPCLPWYSRCPARCPVQWQAFSQADAPSRGPLLDDDDALSQRLQAIGVSADRPVVVIADNSQGWGEDGRIVWMLHTLGHEKTYMVDGGIDALLASGSITIPTVAGAGDFVVSRGGSPPSRRSATGSIRRTSLSTFASARVCRGRPLWRDARRPSSGAKHVYYRWGPTAGCCLTQNSRRFSPAAALPTMWK